MSKLKKGYTRKAPPKQVRAQERQTMSSLLRLSPQSKAAASATIYSQVLKGKGWTKVDSNVMEIVHKWIRAHPSKECRLINSDCACYIIIAFGG